MRTIPQFDENKYYLGKLCSNGHDFRGVGSSLRYRTNRVCTKCGAARRSRDKRELIQMGLCIDCYKPVDVDGQRCSLCQLAQSLRQYNITVDDYNEILYNQNGLCAICGKEPGKERLSVDHCHRTGLVRGLLCQTCNMGLGLFYDDPFVLESAIAYLRPS